MPNDVTKQAVAAMLRGAAAKVTAQHEMLSRLDSATGDGDHGTTMRRAMATMEKAVADAEGKPLAAMLQDVSWALMGVDGGASGPLLGTFFLGMSKAVGEAENLDAAALAAAFDAALAAFQKQSRAQPGDKTMMDALVPGVATLKAALADGQPPAQAMSAAARAAVEGAAATKDMRAKFGRARNLGDRSIGSPDPGATSISLMFEGFAEGLASA
jgi:dihydroxyacetone kinase-like protein